MIILKPKRLLYWILFGIIAYQVFGYVKIQTHGDVIVYKRLAKAIMKYDDYELRYVSIGDVASEIQGTQKERQSLFYGSNILFTYYIIKSRSISPDEQSVYLVAEQVSRVNPPGYDTLWGESVVRLKHEVRLVKKDNRWVVSSFEDLAIDS
jgi:hypothetical protein